MVDHASLSADNPPDSRPYAMVGAGPLSAAIWKTAAPDGWRYRFTLFTINSTTGGVAQLFAPEHVAGLAKLARVLALVLAEDGCLDERLRQELRDLATRLDRQFADDTGW